MIANQGVITLTEQAADEGRLRSILRDWGYSEKEIQRFLGEMQESLREQVNAP